MISKFEEVIFETPDSWGETTITGEGKMQTVIASLHDLGDEWESCSISDCQEFEFVTIIKGDVSLYRRLHVRHPEYRLYEREGQFYTYRGQIFALTDDEATEQARAEVSE